MSLTEATGGGRGPSPGPRSLLGRAVAACLLGAGVYAGIGLLSDAAAHADEQPATTATTQSGEAPATGPAPDPEAPPTAESADAEGSSTTTSTTTTSSTTTSSTTTSTTTTSTTTTSTTTDNTTTTSTTANTSSSTSTAQPGDTTSAALHRVDQEAALESEAGAAVITMTADAAEAKSGVMQALSTPTISMTITAPMTVRSTTSERTATDDGVTTSSQVTCATTSSAETDGKETTEGSVKDDADATSTTDCEPGASGPTATTAAESAGTVLATEEAECDTELATTPPMTTTTSAKAPAPATADGDGDGDKVTVTVTVTVTRTIAPAPADAVASADPSMPTPAVLGDLASESDDTPTAPQPLSAPLHPAPSTTTAGGSAGCGPGANQGSAKNASGPAVGLLTAPVQISLAVHDAAHTAPAMGSLATAATDPADRPD